MTYGKKAPSCDPLTQLINCVVTVLPAVINSDYTVTV